MSCIISNNIDIHKTPGENMRALQEKITAAKYLNKQFVQQFYKDSHKLSDHFEVQRYQWNCHLAKLDVQMSKYRDSEHPVVLKLAIVILNGKKRLLELQAEAEEARRMFDQEQFEYRRLREIWKEELRYLISGRLSLEPPSLVEGAGQDTSDLVNEAGVQEETANFLSFGYFASSLGMMRT